MKEITVRIMGMTCGHCATSIENSMCAVEGVESAKVNLPTGQARLRVRDDVTLGADRLRTIVEDAGFGVVSIDGVQ